jgi:Leucine-rich repeat (LRR) protein
MKKIVLILAASFFLALPSLSQNVTIPDTAFLNALIAEEVDTNGDSLISYAEAEAITVLGLTGVNMDCSITDLTGIEAFVNLKYLMICCHPVTSLDLSGNPHLVSLMIRDDCFSTSRAGTLSSLNVSMNRELRYLDCAGNRLTSLDVSNNTVLQRLYCSRNNLETLDVSNNPLLTVLDCKYNFLTSLDVSNNPKLTLLECAVNLLRYLDVSKNPLIGTGKSAMYDLDLSKMPTLGKVCVWTMPFPPDGVRVGTDDSPYIFYSTNCEERIVSIPDLAFLRALIKEGVDKDLDGLISYPEAEAVTALDVSREENEPGLISDFTGLEAFVNLESFSCARHYVSRLDLSQNLLLTFLDCSLNRLNELDIKHLAKLEHLICKQSGIPSLDVSKNFSLTTLDCSFNDLTGLDVSANKALMHLNCYRNSLESLDVSHNELIEELYCSGNRLKEIDVSHNQFLNHFSCTGNQISALDLTGNPGLQVLYCGGNDLARLDLSKNNQLEFLQIKSMPSLHQVCVWTIPFPPDGLNLETTGSPNINFTVECSASKGLETGGEIELIAAEDFEIFPNPAEDLIWIETKHSGTQTLKIVNINGEVMLEAEMEGPSFQIDLSTFETSIYFITVTSKSYVATKKVIRL